MKNFKNFVLLVSLISMSGILCAGCDFKMNTSSSEPPQSYEEWQQKNDKNYVPQVNTEIPNVKVKVKTKNVPQTYEEWEKQNH